MKINNFCKHLIHPFSKTKLSKSNKILAVAAGIICAFPFILPGIITFYGITYYFKSKNVSKRENSLSLTITTKSNPSASLSISSFSIQNKSKFEKIAASPHTDLQHIKNLVTSKNYKWIDYLKWTKDNQADNFSFLFELSLENRDELDLFLSILNLRTLEKECKKLDFQEQVTIKAPDGKIVLSKQLLSFFIPYYKTAFAGQFNEARKDELDLLDDIDFEVFKDALVFLFFEKSININGDNIHELLILARCYDIKSLSTHCEKWLIANSDDIELLDLIDIGEEYQLSQNFKNIWQERVNRQAIEIFNKDPHLRKKSNMKSLREIAPYVSELNLRNIKISNFKNLALFPNLKTLTLPASTNDKEFAKIPKLDSLKKLDLTITRITNAALKDLDRFSSLTVLNLHRTNITDAGIAYISNLTQLKELNLSDTKVTDASLVHIAKLKKLKSLNLKGMKGTGAGFVHLSKLDQLKFLDLEHTAISNAGLVHITNLDKLKFLNLTWTQITDAGLVHVAKLTQLKSLNLEDTEITDVGLANIANLTRMKFLNLFETKVTNASLIYIANFHHLKELDLGCTRISDSGLAHLANLNKLEVLNLGGQGYITWKGAFTGAGLVHISNLKNLKHLDLSMNESFVETNLVHIAQLDQLKTLNLNSTWVTDIGLAFIANLTQLQTLDLSDTKITDAGLMHIISLNQLKFLALYGTKITDIGLAYIANLTQLQSLNLNYTKITDASLVQFTKLIQLKSLQIGCTRITKAGLASAPNLKHVCVTYFKA